MPAGELWVERLGLVREVALGTPGGGLPVVFRTTDALRVRIWTQCSYGVNG